MEIVHLPATINAREIYKIYLYFGSCYYIFSCQSRNKSCKFLY